MSINSSSSVRLSWTNDNPHNVSRYYFSRHTDVNGGFVDDGYTSGFNQATDFYKNYAGLSDGNRYCAKAHGFTDAGFQGVNLYSGATKWGCWTRRNAAAGRFVATSNRSSSGSQIQFRVKNYAGATRNIVVLGPSFNPIGCNAQDVASNSTYSCNLSGISNGDAIVLMTNTGTGAQTYGALDYN